MIAIRKSYKKLSIFVVTVLYFLINLMYLTRYPFVHSDESWLSGLSRNIFEERSYGVTETFFDLYPRYPHAIKSIFHTVQIIFIKIFGYKIFSVRLVSLIFALATLYYFYRLCKTLFKSKKLAFLATTFLSIDIQFIYASHFARQEIVLLFVLVLALNHYFKNMETHRLKNDLIIGALIGLSIGIHPNSFIIFLPFLFIYLYQVFITKKLKLKNFAYFGLTITGFALIFIAISLSFNSNFFHDYLAYGEQFGVKDPVTSKILQIKYFYQKLYYGVSGTYYTPNIKFQFFLFGTVFSLSIVKLIFTEDENKDKILAIILSILAINIGTILIGRYNQTSIIFIFPLCYILVAYIVFSLKKYYFAPILTLLIAVLLLINTLVNVVPYTNGSYDNYLKEIGRVVESDDSVLANLNSEYYFENDKLFDYRNLSFLRENNLSFRDYIYKNNIEFIIYPEEMDFIYSSRPLWNGVYGNLANYYEDMKYFLEDDCTFVYEFNDSTYGIRIARYIGAKDWNVKIYRVKY